ncbi:caspase family protein [Actinosynnema sp. ALI-1.44]|uniref:caspase family protein n=1 Tax=Actinosynnema sp. ALI-1.44 TaxID=1933779 RepID=UPI001874ECEE|nr:caspase family protein [Actinosynnema sp. ALI-1.44]
MGKRRALVIASQCHGLNPLSFLPAAAHEMADTLLDPSIGGCVPAIEDTPILVDPTVTELDDAVTEAFERASDDEATLFIALVGHGEYTHDDFYFLVSDTTLPPTSRTAFLLAQRIRELLGQYSLLDGLVLLLDTCHAGIAAQQAGNRWIQIVGQAGRRFEVLTASDERTAANGCFSKQLVQVLRSGHPSLGERLRCPDMKVVLSGLCPAQTAVHLAFDGRREITAGDEGLWLARNTAEAWRSSLAADNPAADLIDRLTRDYVAQPELREVVAHLMMGAETITVAGQAGAGKSRLVAALARPSVAPDLLPPRLMDAVLFLSGADTFEGIAGELARQLGRTVPGFADAAREFETTADPGEWQTADAFERAVAGPLRLCGAPVRIAVDGIDNVGLGVSGRLRAALGHLPAQVVVSSRHAAEDQATVWLGPRPSPTTGPEAPADEDFEFEEPPLPIRAEGPLDLVDLLGATGTARVPTTVLVAASGSPLSVVRDLLVQNDFATRLEPGTPQETVVYNGGRGGNARAHSAIADALLDLAPPADRASGSPEQVYADAALAEHLWYADRHDEIVECLENRGSAVPAENYATWRHWSHNLEIEPGYDARPTIVATARYLTSMVKIGELTEALGEFRSLLPRAEQVLAVDDPELFVIRNNIGYLLFETGAAGQSATHLRSVTEDAAAHLGAWHEETLHARHLLAVATGKLANSTESARLSAELIPDAERALGPDHEVTINARLNYDFHTRNSGNPPPAVFREQTPSRRIRGRAER